MINVLVICSTFSGIVLITFLLNNGKIGSGAFATLFICIILFSLALYGFDRLKELDLGNLKLVLSEIREVKKDIYAKAETVKKLGEEVAELTAFNVTRVGRFVSPDLQEKMLEARDRINKILREIGSDEEKIRKIASQIDDMVLHDLKRDVHSKIQEITHTMFTSGIKINRQEIHDRAEQLLFKKYDRDVLTGYLKEQNVYSEEIDRLLDKVDKFSKEKEL